TLAVIHSRRSARNSVISGPRSRSMPSLPGVEILESNSKFDLNKALVTLSRLADGPIASTTRSAARPTRSSAPYAQSKLLEASYPDEQRIWRPIQSVLDYYEAQHIGGSRARGGYWRSVDRGVGTAGFHGPPVIARRAYSITASMTALAWRRLREAATS